MNGAVSRPAAANFARMVPFGRLREPLTALRRADAVLVTRADAPFDKAVLERTLRRYARADVPVFYARHTLTALRGLADGTLCNVQTFAGQPVAAFSGIARPVRFIRDLERLVTDSR